VKIWTCQQRSREWFRLRANKPTASHFSDLVKKFKNGWGSTDTEARTTYKYKLVVGRLTNLPPGMGSNSGSDYKGEWVKRGIEREPEAREQFAHDFKVKVTEIGFVTDEAERVGCSPDGLINDGKEILEIKVLAPWNHLQLLCEGHDEKYYPQVQGQLWLTGARRAHFYSWHEYWPAFHVVTERDERFIDFLATAVYHFCDEVDAAEKMCRKMGCVPELIEGAAE
jgi:hypothetical protein